MYTLIMPIAQRDAVDALSVRGWELTNHYGDGLIRMQLQNTEIGVFVRKSGVITPPNTNDTHIARVLLCEAGFTIEST